MQEVILDCTQTAKLVVEVVRMKAAVAASAEAGKSGMPAIYFFLHIQTELHFIISTGASTRSHP